MSADLFFRFMQNNSSLDILDDRFVYAKMLSEFSKMKAPISPSMIRKLCLKYSDKHVKWWMPNKISFKELEKLGENVFALKDGNAKQVGEFLNVAIPLMKNKKELSLEYFKNCKICYRLTLNSNFCANHDRTKNQAGYRRGKIIKKRLGELKRVDPSISLAGKRFFLWIENVAPHVYEKVSKSATPLDALIILDTCDNSKPQKQKLNEYKKMVRGIAGESLIKPQSEHIAISKNEAYFQYDSWSVLTEESQYNLLLQKYILEAEQWLEAIQVEPRGGKRVGAGRPRSK